jgi:hypothetical protein
MPNKTGGPANRLAPPRCSQPLHPSMCLQMLLTVGREGSCSLLRYGKQLQHWCPLVRSPI